ncbi:MAG TPA: hypothetical protein VLD67_21580 [Vicinamibacterales bacterium]|nr:hypothetical protein [Vicinamibacterales bacterium]
MIESGAYVFGPEDGALPGHVAACAGWCQIEDPRQRILDRATIPEGVRFAATGRLPSG